MMALSGHPLSHPLSGIFAALLTPFDDNERVDHGATAALVEFQVRQGLQGLYVGGSSGEAMLQSQAERAEYLRTVAAANAGRLHLIAHVGTVATRDALELSEVAQAAGYEAISAVTPFYYPFSRTEVMAHYIAIADQAALPLIVYNFPAIAQAFSVSELGTLLQHPRIIGVKHTSTDLFALDRLRRHNPDALVYNGYDEMCLAGLCMGAQGAIGTTYNFMGDVFVEIARLVAASSLPEAQRLQRMANLVIEVLIECGVMPSSKALLDLMGVRAGPSRRPFRTLGADDRAKLAVAIRPVLDWRERRVPAAA